VVKGGVTTPKGFLAGGVRAGIKKSGKPDLALLVSEVPAVAAGAFTTNRFCASPVKLSRLHLRHKTHQAIIVNSGNANCANGKRGERDAHSMAKFIAGAMGLGVKEALVASTGIIGKPLPLDKIKAAVPDLLERLSPLGGESFAGAIMTTDTVKKELAVKVRIARQVVTIGGACKGVGMIYPEMATARHPSTSLRIVPSKAAGGGRVEGHATMLAFITTDAAISKRALEGALDEAVKDSFNMVSVDGDMSTNDTCFVMANGLAGNRKIVSRGRDYDDFVKGLKFLTVRLAKMIARDGEGATKFVEIEVAGAENAHDARIIARKISTSNLLKCAVSGGDPNWGRVAAAAGSSGIGFDPDKVDIILGGVNPSARFACSGLTLSNVEWVRVLAGGGPVNYDMKKAEKLFRAKDVSIKVDLHAGSGKATAWTCDFSKEYVAINSEYST
jgi:glutamate N-acetyltransferase / amino-acid N-acetyltransferase